MVGNFDYNNDEVMKILNNAEYSDEQKKQLFEKYKEDLKDLRRKEIINRLNECAKNNPIITQEEYINFLKKYNEDDLSKPFEVIEKELNDFSNEMDVKYKEFLAKKEAETAAATPVAPVQEEAPVVETAPIEEEITPDVVPAITAEPVVETEPEVAEEITPSVEVNTTVFENKEVKEVMPEDIKDNRGEKGNASAIIISIIAIIVGMVIMYAIIKLK